MDAGFEWTQEDENYNAATRTGYHNLDLSYYLKWYFKNSLVLRLERLI